MSRALPRAVRSLVIILALATSAAVLPSATARPARADDTPPWAVERFEAPSGTAASTGVARRVWGDVDTVVMARGDDFADALAAAPVAAALDAPLLLTDRDAMPRHVWEQIEHFLPRRVVLMGGPAAVADSVVEELRRWGVQKIDRISGANRFQTAVAAMDLLRATGADADPFVVRGEGSGGIGGWEDAVAVSQHAALLGAPILLTRPTSLPQETADAIAADDPDGVTIVGGEAAVSGEVSDALWALAPTDRLFGPSRYETSLAVADATRDAGADLGTLWIVSGGNWQDALVAGTAAGTLGGVLVYANPFRWATSPGREWVLAALPDVDQVNVVADRSSLPTSIDLELIDLAHPAPPWSPPAGVRITPADDPQAVVDAHDPGTTFVFTAGVHRGAQVRPRDGDRFTGEPGAVLTGAIDVDTTTAYEEDGVWIIPGVTYEPPAPPTITRSEDGREGEVIQTDLFAGWSRLVHVGRAESLTRPTQWHFDTANDRIMLRRDPATLGPLQMSATPWAIASAADDVEVDHLRFERYASQAKEGVVDGHDGRRWHIHDVTIHQAKSAAIRTGYGARIVGNRLTHNGQIGITGGDHHPDGSQAPILVEGNHIAYNGEVGYRWGWEAGGAKLTNTIDSVYRQNWAHNNRGPGLWCDLDCRNPHFLSNLSEQNTIAGVLIEETVTALADSNVVRGNGAFAVGDLGGGFWVSNSPGVELRWNIMEANRLPIVANHNGIPPGEHGVLEIADFYVHDNDMRVDAYLPGLRVRTEEPERYLRDDIRWERNVYRLRQDRDEHFWWGRKVTVPEWQSTFKKDPDGEFLDINLEAFAQPQPFAPRATGAGW